MGDQFALMEGVIALAVVLKRFTFRAVPGSDPGMTTGGPAAPLESPGLVAPLLACLARARTPSELSWSPLCVPEAVKRQLDSRVRSSI